MSNDPRIVELLSEIVIELRTVSTEQRETNKRLTAIEHQQEISNIKQDAMIDELERLPTALMRVAEGSSVSFEKLDDHERRIKALEAHL